MTTSIVTVAAIAWVLGVFVGFGLGGKFEMWRKRNEGQRRFAERNRRVS